MLNKVSNTNTGEILNYRFAKKILKGLFISTDIIFQTFLNRVARGSIFHILGVNIYKEMTP